MELSRRSFFKGGLALTAVTVLPQIVQAKAPPVIWADGIHDDTAGIQALLDNEPFRVAAERGEAFRLDGGAATLRNLYLKTSNTIHIRPHNDNVQIHGCYWEHSGEGPLLCIHEGTHLEMSNQLMRFYPKGSIQS